MPAERLLTSISKPTGIFSSTASSIFLMSQPPSGPMTMPPRNMGISVPTIMPMVATAPTTPPRSS